VQAGWDAGQSRANYYNRPSSGTARPPAAPGRPARVADRGSLTAPGAPRETPSATFPRSCGPGDARSAR
jgi:hypothetical protein